MTDRINGVAITKLQQIDRSLDTPHLSPGGIQALQDVLTALDLELHARNGAHLDLTMGMHNLGCLLDHLEAVDRAYYTPLTAVYREWFSAIYLAHGVDSVSMNIAVRSLSLYLEDLHKVLTNGTYVHPEQTGTNSDTIRDRVMYTQPSIAPTTLTRAELEDLPQDAYKAYVRTVRSEPPYVQLTPVDPEIACIGTDNTQPAPRLTMELKRDDYWRYGTLVTGADNPARPASVMVGPVSTVYCDLHGYRYPEGGECPGCYHDRGINGVDGTQKCASTLNRTGI